MPPWRETQGYQVKVDEDVVLNYPEEPEDGAFAFNTPPLNPPLLRSGGGSARYFPGEESKRGATRPHWTFPKPTGRNMSVLIEVGQASLPAIGDQIAAFNSDGLLVGVGWASGVSRKVAGGDAYATGLAVWGDDLSTEEVDGLLEGETFSLKLWDSDRNMELDLETDAVLTGQGTVYETNGFSALEVIVQPSVPDAFYLAQNYPNPFNSVTKLSYGLPEASRMSIRIYDISGRMIATLVEGDIPAGCHTVTWEAASIATGVYLVRLEASDFSAVRKVILVK